MSISVTVNGNPMCISKRVVLSDLEQIKKNERERRRRLRLEQVRQQSKEISSKLLDRAKNIAKKTINDLENGKDSELKRMHDKKISEIRQKYQEDMEDIGLAHISAAAQPDVDVLLENERCKNQVAAAERGKEAVQRLKKTAMQEDPMARQQERIRQVREVENVRSTMIANLSKKKPSKSKKSPLPPPLSSTAPSIIPPPIDEPHKIPRISPKDGKSVKSPEKPKSPMKVSVSSVKPSKSVRKSPPPQHIAVQIEPSSQHVAVQIDPPPPHAAVQKPSDKAKPKKPTSLNQIQQTPHYNPSDYQQESSTPSISDDSSYFSDPASATNVSDPRQVPPKPQNIPSSSKIHFYDYSTRQKKTYDKPKGLVERSHHHSSPDAIELARRTSTEQSKSSSTENQRLKAQQRGTNAALREKVKKDYENLLKNLDHLSREEQKLKACRSNRLIVSKERRQQKKNAKQAEMNKAYESGIDRIDRIITINNNEEKSESSSPDSLYEQSDDSPMDTPTDVPSRNEQILEMLKKVERQKRLLLEEFGANLPDSIFNASATRLFDERKPEPTASPEIKIIKVVDDDDKKAQRIETAVQTSQMTELYDKSVQVELVDSGVSEKREKSSIELEYVEPIVTVLRPEVVASSSDSSPGIKIDFKKQQVKVTPTKWKSKRKSVKSLPTSEKTSPVKMIPIDTERLAPGSASSAPTSRVSSPQEIDEDSRKEFKLPGKNIRVSVDTSTDVSFDPNRRPDDRRRKKSYVRVKQPILKRICVNNSDTSTSYASLPAVQPGSSYLEPINSNVTPILQMLDSSANESVIRRFRERDISPVSTPETPSPRTMRLPSNIPDVEKITRMLRFDDEHGDREKKKEKIRERQISREESVKNNEVICECSNSACRLIHREKSNMREEIKVGNNPETMKRYDELQNICAERIASLNALIKQVRDEKQGDYLLTAPSDDTSLMQLPDPRPRNDLYSVQKLVESIEAIHSRLAKTLQESQKIITGNLNTSRRIESPKIELREVLTPKIDKSPSSPKSPKSPRSPKPSDKSVSSETHRKPKITSEETVKLDLQRFKSSVPSKPPKSSNHDQIVEKLSQEILEQSRSVEKTSPPLEKEPSSPRKSESPPSSREQPKESFTPLLAGIPRVAKALPAVPPSNGRRRPPPVSQYIEALSPPHELSTIAEFDTPDTVNRSQMSTKSPGKSRKALPLCSSLKEREIPEEVSGKTGDEEMEVKKEVNDSGKSDNILEKINKITSSSSNSFSGLSGISEILSTPTSDIAHWASSPPEHMEDHLRKLGLLWAIPILRKTRQASALSSSSNSDITLVATMRKTKSPVRNNNISTQCLGLPDFSDVSSISIREASKSTERAVLMKARTSTPNIQNSHSSSEKSTDTTTSGNHQDNNDSINFSFKKP